MKFNSLAIWLLMENFSNPHADRRCFRRGDAHSVCCGTTEFPHIVFGNSFRLLVGIPGAAGKKTTINGFILTSKWE